MLRWRKNAFEASFAGVNSDDGVVPAHEVKKLKDMNGHLELAERLIAQGADINATLKTTDTAGTSVLLLAVMNDYLELAELLIAHFASWENVTVSIDPVLN